MNKKVVIFVALILSMTSVYSQNYFYSGGQQRYYTEDNKSIIVVVKDTIVLRDLYSRRLEYKDILSANTK